MFSINEHYWKLGIWIEVTMVHSKRNPFEILKYGLTKFQVEINKKHLDLSKCQQLCSLISAHQVHPFFRAILLKCNKNAAFSLKIPKIKKKVPFCLKSVFSVISYKKSYDPTKRKKIHNTLPFYNLVWSIVQP